VTGGPASGTASANVTVTVVCKNQYTISAAVSGLNGGTGMVLQDNGADNLSITGNGTFAFATKIASGGAYAVTVSTQPTSTPAQFCTVAAGTGTASAAVTVNVTCRNVGQYVFVANTHDNSGTGTIGVFAITASSGAIAAANGTPAAPAIVPASTDDNPVGLGVDPTGPYLYVANSGLSNLVTGTPNTISSGNDVATFTIGAAGALTEGTAAALTDNLSPVSLAIDSAGPYLYVGSNDFNADGAIVAFHPSAGVLGGQLTGSPYEGTEPYGMAVDSTKAFLFTANPFDGVVVVDPITTGTLPTTAPTADPAAASLTSPYAVAASPTGLYVYITDTVALPATTAGTVTAFSYSATTGALTKVHASYAVGIGPEGVAIDPTNSFLYVSNAHDGTVSAFKISGTDGSLAVIGTYTSTTTGIPSTSPTALTVDPSGQYLYVANGDDGSVTAFSITAGTGVLVLVGAGPVGATNGTGVGTSAIAIE
jgi:6-phosphogluconolactonase